jgi:hypothetical protein
VITCEKLEEGKRYAYYFGKLLKEEIINRDFDYTYNKYNLTFESGSLNGVYKDRDENLVKKSDKYRYVLGKLDDIKDEEGSDGYKILHFSTEYQFDAYRTIQSKIEGHTLGSYGSNLDITEGTGKMVDIVMRINTLDGKFILLQGSQGGRRSLRNTFRRRRGMSHLRRRKTAARRRSSKRSKMT